MNQLPESQPARCSQTTDKDSTLEHPWNCNKHKNHRSAAWRLIFHFLSQTHNNDQGYTRSHFCTLVRLGVQCYRCWNQWSYTWDVSDPLCSSWTRDLQFGKSIKSFLPLLLGSSLSFISFQSRFHWFFLLPQRAFCSSQWRKHYLTSEMFHTSHSYNFIFFLFFFLGGSICLPASEHFSQLKSFDFISCTLMLEMFMIISLECNRLFSVCYVNIKTVC